MNLEQMMPCKVIWHENKTRYLSVKKIGGIFHLKLHKLFQNAPTPVFEAILDFVQKNDPAARGILRQMVHLHFSKNKEEPSPLNSMGKVYDLQEIFDRTNASFKLKGITIGWSKRLFRGRFRSITFGCFDTTCRQIRINPILDSLEVPLYFIEFIVYHELLHALLPPKVNGEGRCSIHSKQFQEEERKFPHYEQAKKWAKNFIQRRHGRA
jgi:hypothetical protein